MSRLLTSGALHMVLASRRQLHVAGALLLVLAPGPPVCGQGFNPHAPMVRQDDPRVLRARREQAVAYVGPEGRALVESYGDDACRALFNCTPGVAKRLTQFYSSGDMEKKIAHPRRLLDLIGQPGAGDDVAWFAMEHAAELSDIDACEAYLQNPLQYTCALKTLAQGATELRAHKLSVEAAQHTPAWTFQLDQRTAITWGVLVLLVALIWWWRRRRQGVPGAA